MFLEAGGLCRSASASVCAVDVKPPIQRTASCTPVPPRHGVVDQSDGGLEPFRAEEGHSDLLGVGDEQSVQFLGCRLDEVAVASGAEGFQDEGDVGGVFGDAGAVRLA